jgi:DNA-binding beta-propeller fold protein YncE
MLMQQRRNLLFQSAGAVLLLGIAAGCTALASDLNVPRFEVDPLWPMPLEYPYILGPVSGLTVAPDGNILIVTRQDGFSQINEINSVTSTGTCCTPSQAVLEYAPDGSLVREWGGPDNGYDWPQRPHGIAIDPEGNIWIGGGVVTGGGGGGFGGGGGAAPNAAPIDSHILKFSRDGRHLATIGQPGQGAAANQHSATSFGGAARFSFDASANEVYVADGYANRRVAVLDMTTGELKRSWGAYGNEPDDADLGAYDPAASPAQQFRSVTCAELSNDGHVYVCDRGNNRIQVFRTDGTFVAEQVIAPATLSLGSVWDVAFSPDSDQRYLYVADGMNERVYVLERESLEVRTSFGTGGRVPGTFHELGSVAVDAQGNLYTAENGQGRRVQKFVNRGTGPVTAEHQGVVWPGQ